MFQPERQKKRALQRKDRPWRRWYYGPRQEGDEWAKRQRQAKLGASRGGRGLYRRRTTGLTTEEICCGHRTDTDTAATATTAADTDIAAAAAAAATAGAQAVGLHADTHWRNLQRCRERVRSRCTCTGVPVQYKNKIRGLYTSTVLVYLSHEEQSTKDTGTKY